MSRLLIIIVALVLLCAPVVRAQSDAPIYQDASRPVEQRVEDLLARLTLEEKIDLLGGVRGFYVRSIERLNTPEMRMADGPVGVRNTDPPGTAYPAGIALAATWDRDLAYQVGEAMGRDSRARGVHYLLGPAVNIYRVPQNGRNFEYMGEDPYLAAQLAVPVIKGIQSQGVAATIKHYAANNQEINRGSVSVEVDERTLREIYLPAFKAAVQEGDVLAVMAAYNRLNGTYCSANQWLMTDVLKHDWGFEGVAMSDWGASHDTLGTALGGLDLEMPSGEFFSRERLLPLIRQGAVSDELIDDKVRRILRVGFTIGAFDRPQKDESIPLDDPRSVTVALQEAREGTVLLKNAGDTLPLHRKAIKTIAVIGPNADPAVAGGGGSSRVPAPQAVSLLDGLTAVAGPDVRVVRVPAAALEAFDGMYTSPQFITPDGQPGLRAEYFNNRHLTGEPVLTRVDQHINFDWNWRSPAEEINRDEFSARWTGQLRIPAGGTYTVRFESDDGARVFIDDEPIFDAWYDRGAISELKKLDLTEGLHDVRIEYYEGGGDATIRLGLAMMPASPFDEEQARQVAEADAVVIAVGFGPGSETEGTDRTLGLPTLQDELITAAAKLNPRSIVVLNSGGNVDMPWLDQVKALLHAWYPGQAGGTAIAEILFGDVNPSGKLPISLEQRFEDNAGFGNYPGDEKVHYREGIFIGYRHLDARAIDPLFCFGHGLSYTTFDYANLKIDITDDPDAWIKVTADITNTGDRAGHEVAQLYVSDAESSLPRPVKELKGFARVHLEPGETKQVRFDLPPVALSFFDPATGSWIVEPGVFAISVGPSSRTLPLSESIQLDETQVRQPVGK